MEDREKHLDEMIAKYAIDKSWDCGTSLKRLTVRKLFELAFPPDDLPKSLIFVSKEDNLVDFDEVITRYSPYYTFIEMKTTSKSGKQITKSTLKLKLVNAKKYRQILIRQGLVRADLQSKA